MSVGVFLAVLVAALLHASWNALVKFGEDKVSGMFMLSVAHAILAVPLILISPFPAPEVWPWLLGSGLIHFAYQAFLMLAYQHGDLSRVYPIARGTAPMIVLVFSAVFLSDQLRSVEVGGILLVGLGILLMARGVFTQGEERRLLPFALGSAAATAGYSIVDGLGARVAGDATQYLGWLMVISGVLFTTITLFWKGTAPARVPLGHWARGFVAAAFSLLAYWIAVWAMTVAPIALVTALRETSVLFAVLIGIVFFGEKSDRGKFLAAVLIVAGVMATRI